MKREKKYPLREFNLGLGLDNLAVDDIKKILLKARDKYKSKLKETIESMLAASQWEAPQRENGSIIGMIERRLEDFLDDAIDQLGLQGNTTFNFLDFNNYPVNYWKAHLSWANKSLKNIEISNYLSKSVRGGSTDFVPFNTSDYLCREYGNRRSIEDGKKYLEILTKAKKVQSERSKKITLILKVPFERYEEHKDFKDLKLMIYETFVKSLDHERITELRLKKWENRWPYELPQRESLNDILNNANLKALDKAIKKYGDEYTEVVEEALLDFYTDYLRKDERKAVSTISDSWINHPIARTFKEKRKEARENMKKDISILFDKLRGKQKKISEKDKEITKLKKELSNQITENEKLKHCRVFLIKKAVELASKHLKVDREMREYESISAELADEVNSLKGQITYWQTQDDQLRNTIQSLQTQITQLQKEKKSLIKQKGTAQQRAQQLRKDSRTNHESWQEKYDLLEQENIQLTDNHQELEQKLLRKIGRLVKEQEKNQKLTKTKRAKALLAQKLRTDLNQTQTSLSTLLGQRDDLYFQLAQFNTTNQSLQSANQQLEQEKTDLNNRLTDKDSLITSLTTEQSQFKEQIQQDYNQLQSSYNSLNDKNQTQAQTIQQLEQQHRQFEEQKQQWKQREQQLLAEIEFLKNPPRQANKENILVETENQQLREQIKELDQKLPAEKIRAINLILAEQRNRFNQQLEQKDSQARERERERERSLSAFPKTEWESDLMNAFDNPLGNSDWSNSVVG